jgi:outer membrane lipoprotein-sorting protein
MRSLLLLSILALIPALVGARDENAPAPAEILRRVDQALFPDSTSMTIMLTDHRPKIKDRSFRIEVKAVRKVGAVLSLLSPATEVGKSYLFRDRSIWISIPGLPNALRVSSKEAFMDSAFANNDLMDTEYSDDYEVTLEGVMDVVGGRVYILNCAARTPQVAYNRVRMTVDAENYIPARFEYFTKSGLLLKTCTFHDIRQLGGRLRASRIEMRDASVANSVSVIAIEKMAQAGFNPGIFSIESLRK